MKPLFWILKCKETGFVLCDDNRRRGMAAGVERIKKYKREGNALKRAGLSYVCHAVHEGDTLDCCGQITEPNGVRR